MMVDCDEASCMVNDFGVKQGESISETNWVKGGTMVTSGI